MTTSRRDSTSSRHSVVEDDHTGAEWLDFERRLNALTDDQVLALANALGLRFTETGATRDDYLNIMGETYWDEFEAAYRTVVDRAK